MTTKYLHVLAIDPGGVTGWCCLTVLRRSIFADDTPSGIAEWDYGEFTGPEPVQATAIARLAREIQSLDYKTGPAVIIEDWDQKPEFRSTDPETLSPVRLGAMLSLLGFQGKLGDATVHFQSRTVAFGSKATTDDKLRKYGLYVEGSDHIRAATKHAVTALRRARENWDFAIELWPYPANGLG
jgi:hypothetical protein